MHIEPLLAIGRAIVQERERDAWAAARDGAETRPFFGCVDGEVRIVAYGKTSHMPTYRFCLADQSPEDFDLLPTETLAAASRTTRPARRRVRVAGTDEGRA